MNNTERSYKFLVDIGYGDLVDIIKFITNNNPYSSDIIQLCLLPPGGSAAASCSNGV